MKILIIEDEYTLADTVSDILKDENFEVHIEYDGIKGEEEALTDIYDLILLDVMLPHKNGFEVLESIKDKIDTPIIMLTAKSEMEDKLNGLENGAVDYITKPFHIRELVARVKIALKKAKNVKNVELYEFGDFQLDINKAKIYCGNQEIQISSKEQALLELLILNKDRIIARETLAEKIWGFNSNSEYNNVEVYISFLRKKLKKVNSKVLITYIKDKGYIMGENNNK